MEDLLTVAIDEIALEGSRGMLVHDLLNAVGQNMPIAGLQNLTSPALKQLLWRALLRSPEAAEKHINFFVLDGNTAEPSDGKLLSFPEGATPIERTDERIATVAGAEQLSVIMRASDELSLSAMGVSSEASAGSASAISDAQRCCLERLAQSRWSGRLQHELAKEVGTVGQNYFHVVRGLERRGLIVRNTVMIAQVNSLASVVHLKRFAHVKLAKSQTLWIKSKDADESVCLPSEAVLPTAEDAPSSAVLLTDINVGAKAICDRLEREQNKQLVMKKLKEDTGFVGNAGHRSYRRVRKYLTENGFIKEVLVERNNKRTVTPQVMVELLKPWDPEGITTGAAAQKDQGDADDDEADVLPERQTIAELTLTRQLALKLLEAGLQGATRSDLEAPHWLNNKKNRPRFDAMLKQLKPLAATENQGKVIQSRFVVPQDALLVQQHVLKPQQQGSFMADLLDAAGLSDDPTGITELLQRAQQAPLRLAQREAQTEAAQAPAADNQGAENVPLSQPLVDLLSIGRDATAVGIHDASTNLMMHQRFAFLTAQLKDKEFLLEAEITRLLQQHSSHGRLDRKTVLRLLQRGQQRKLWTWIVLEPTANRVIPLGVVIRPGLEVSPDMLLAMEAHCRDLRTAAFTMLTAKNLERNALAKANRAEEANAVAEAVADAVNIVRGHTPEQAARTKKAKKPKVPKVKAPKAPKPPPEPKEPKQRGRPPKPKPTPAQIEQQETLTRSERAARKATHSRLQNGYLIRRGVRFRVLHSTLCHMLGVLGEGHEAPSEGPNNRVHPDGAPFEIPAALKQAMRKVNHRRFVPPVLGAAAEGALPGAPVTEPADGQTAAHVAHPMAVDIAAATPAKAPVRSSLGAPRSMASAVQSAMQDKLSVLLQSQHVTPVVQRQPAPQLAAVLEAATQALAAGAEQADDAVERSPKRQKVVEAEGGPANRAPAEEPSQSPVAMDTCDDDAEPVAQPAAVPVQPPKDKGAPQGPSEGPSEGPNGAPAAEETEVEPASEKKKRQHKEKAPQGPATVPVKGPATGPLKALDTEPEIAQPRRAPNALRLTSALHSSPWIPRMKELQSVVVPPVPTGPAPISNTTEKLISKRANVSVPDVVVDKMLAPRREAERQKEAQAAERAAAREAARQAKAAEKRALEAAKAQAALEKAEQRKRKAKEAKKQPAEAKQTHTAATGAEAKPAPKRKRKADAAAEGGPAGGPTPMPGVVSDKLPAPRTRKPQDGLVKADKAEALLWDRLSAQDKALSVSSMEVLANMRISTYLEVVGCKSQVPNLSDLAASGRLVVDLDEYRLRHLLFKECMRDLERDLDALASLGILRKETQHCAGKRLVHRYVLNTVVRLEDSAPLIDDAAAEGATEPSMAEREELTGEELLKYQQRFPSICKVERYTVNDEAWSPAALNVTCLHYDFTRAPSAINDYWTRLEWVACTEKAAIDAKQCKTGRVYPHNSFDGLIQPHNWSQAKAMSAVQWLALKEKLDAGLHGLADSKKVADELGLPVHQVLYLSYNEAARKVTAKRKANQAPPARKRARGPPNRSGHLIQQARKVLLATVVQGDQAGQFSPHGDALPISAPNLAARLLANRLYAQRRKEAAKARKRSMPAEHPLPYSKQSAVTRVGRLKQWNLEQDQQMLIALARYFCHYGYRPHIALHLLPFELMGPLPRGATDMAKRLSQAPFMRQSTFSQGATEIANLCNQIYQRRLQRRNITADADGDEGAGSAAKPEGTAAGMQSGGALLPPLPQGVDAEYICMAEGPEDNADLQRLRELISSVAAKMPRRQNPPRSREVRAATVEARTAAAEAATAAGGSNEGADSAQPQPRASRRPSPPKIPHDAHFMKHFGLHPTLGKTETRKYADVAALSPAATKAALSNVSLRTLATVQALISAMLESDLNGGSSMPSAQRAQVLLDRFGRDSIESAVASLRVMGFVNSGGAPKPFELTEGTRRVFKVTDYSSTVLHEARTASTWMSQLGSASGDAATLGMRQAMMGPNTAWTGGMVADLLDAVHSDDAALGLAHVALLAGENSEAAGARAFMLPSVTVEVTTFGSDVRREGLPMLQLEDLVTEPLIPVTQVAEDAAAREHAEGLAAHGQAEGFVEAALQIVRDSASEGVSEGAFRSGMMGKFSDASIRQLLDLQQELVHYGLVVLVNGYDSVRLVAAEFAAPFVFFPDEQPDAYVVSAPWVSTQGHVNGRVWQLLARRVAVTLLRHPGIPEAQLLEQLQDTLCPQDARSLLELLESKEVLAAQTRSSLSCQGGNPLGRLMMGSGAEIKREELVCYFTHPSVQLQQCWMPEDGEKHGKGHKQPVALDLDELAGQILTQQVEGVQ